MIDHKVEAFREAFEKRVAADAELEAVRRRLDAAEKLVADCQKAESQAQNALLKEAAGVAE